MSWHLLAKQQQPPLTMKLSLPTYQTLKLAAHMCAVFMRWTHSCYCNSDMLHMQYLYNTQGWFNHTKRLHPLKRFRLQNSHPPLPLQDFELHKGKGRVGVATRVTTFPTSLILNTHLYMLGPTTYTVVPSIHLQINVTTYQFVSSCPAWWHWWSRCA